MVSDWVSFSADLRHSRSARVIFAILLVVTGPVLVVATYLALQPLNEGTSGFLRVILTFDLVYVLVASTLVLWRVSQVVTARRAKSSGSRLHVRLSAVFAALALVPAVLVALFAMLTVNQSFEGWFSDRVRNALGVSREAAQAYQQDQRDAIRTDISAVAVALNDAERRFALEDGQVRQILEDIKPQIQRGVKEMFVIDNLGTLLVRGPESYRFNFEQPTPEQIAAADQDPLVIVDQVGNEVRALLRLQDFPNRYLLIARDIDGRLAGLLDETTATAGLYQQLEQDRGRLLFDFGILYLVFALILVLAATWVGLWFAERLARPVGDLAAAARRVGAGDLDARVENLRGDDEISMLGRYFNQMTKQLKGQRDNLVQNAEQADRRRRLFDSVLSSVTSGVVGLDKEGHITFLNRAAKRALDLDDAALGLAFGDLVPEISPLLAELSRTRSTSVRQEMKLVRHGKQESLLVQIASRENDMGQVEGTVIAIEDVTDLVSAQRMAAWGDVARRIAHEIKNPLTPIKLSADRIHRKFAPALGKDAGKLEEMTGVISRQTDDLRRIVDEFSKFARMPQAEKRAASLTDLLRDVTAMQDAGQVDVALSLTLPDGDVVFSFDQTMLRQALTNLVKNAGEAIAMRTPSQPLPKGQIDIELAVEDDQAILQIADNGIGLPADRAKLFEPYVTHRDEGTGLGLPIVVKIIEEHGGSLTLDDRRAADGTKTQGAVARVTLPMIGAVTEKEKQVEYG